MTAGPLAVEILSLKGKHCFLGSGPYAAQEEGRKWLRVKNLYYLLIFNGLVILFHF
jgi:hypothetical protein